MNWSARLGRGVGYLVLVVVALGMLGPFVWSLYASFITNDIHLNVFPIPEHALGVQNYTFLLSHGQMGRWYLNSVVVTAAITLTNLLVNSMAGYALCRLRIPGRRLLFLIILGIMMVPAQVLYIPVYILIVHLGWANSFLALIVPFLANPFGIFLMHQFYATFPKELEEAGRMDGLTRIGTFFRLALPLAGPALVAQAIFLFVWNWNSFAFPSIVESTESMYTLPVAIYQMTHSTYTNETAKSMAGIMMATVPVIVTYFVLQRRFIEGVTHTGIKG